MIEMWTGLTVEDTDHHFTIDPFTREIISKDPQKDVLIQNDHNSERFTFEIPRFIEGFDVGNCDEVLVCYTNGRSTGVYPVDDLKVYPFVNDVLTCSWLVSQNATKNIGKLSFMLRFAKVNADATVEYAWSTKSYENVKVLETIDSIDRFEGEYVDPIQRWKNDVKAEMSAYVETTVENQVDVAQITTNKNDISNLETKVAVQKSRMDAFTAMKEGSTTGDAELADMRIDIFGNTFENAGTAIRANFEMQEEAIENSLSTVYLPVSYEKISNMGFVLNNSKQAMMQRNDGTKIYAGVITKTGFYNLAAKTLLTKHEMNTSNFVDYIFYDTVAVNNMYVEVGTRFYVLGIEVPPCLKVSYLNEQMIVAVSPDETYYKITAGNTVQATEIEGLLSDNKVILSGGRYKLQCFPVIRGEIYRLRSSYFDYPSDVYRLFGFSKDIPVITGQSYIAGEIRTNVGVIDILVRAPLDGYMLVSDDSATPANFTVSQVASMTKGNFIEHKPQPYKKLLTIGDSLSGNSNLWQPTVIEMLNIPEYGLLGGAGLTVADQGTDVNTIYNRVMSMEVDESVDLITFWGGFNDFNSAIELSSLSEQLNLETRDSTTFYGGALNCVEKILSTYPLKQVIMVGTTPFYLKETWQTKKNSSGHTIEDYVNAFKEIADYYSIPFIDLLHTSGFNKYNYSTYYLDQDYWLHPNAEGNKIVGKKLAGFVKSIDGTY